MTAAKYFMICCDQCGYPTSGGVVDMRTTQRAARKVAKAQGWCYIPPSASPHYRGKDLCPNCQPVRA